MRRCRWEQAPKRIGARPSKAIRNSLGLAARDVPPLIEIAAVSGANLAPLSARVLTPLLRNLRTPSRRERAAQTHFEVDTRIFSPSVGSARELRNLRRFMISHRGELMSNPREVYCVTYCFYL